MRIELAYITPRRQRLKSGAAQSLLDDFVTRASRFDPTEPVSFETEAALFTALEKASSRTHPVLILLDSRGDSLTSEGIADRLRQFRENGTQHLVFAIGPADGWSPAAWNRANLRLSLGAITLPHELALVVLAEQVYRAQSILAGHPYHGSHA